MNSTFEQAVAAQRAKLALPAAVEALFQRWRAQDAARICTIVAHTLRHDGQSVTSWQPWLALAAWGNLELRDIGLARALALLAGVYADLMSRLPAQAPRLVDYRALNYVLGLAEPPPLPDAARMELVAEGYDSLTRDEGFALLADAIVRRDWEACRNAFELLAGFALEGAALQPWNAEVSPGYEPAPAALAAVARDAGFALDRLAAPTLGWLWPAVESRPDIVPVCWPPFSV